MAKQPTHFKLTVNRPIEVVGTQLLPGARYTVKAAVHATIKEQHPAAIATADPIFAE